LVTIAGVAVGGQTVHLTRLVFGFGTYSPEGFSGGVNNMNSEVTKVSISNPEEMDNSLAQAVSTLYQSVKTRMEKQMLSEINNEKPIYGKSN
jgi:hypothetical protein